MATAYPSGEARTTSAAAPVDDYADSSLVPDPWKTLFTNEEWLMHRIVVLSTYGFLAIAVVAHILVYLWRPWLP
jgi:light-harvesting complex 1 beta chain